ncbi:hypothetical protein ACHAWF_008323 [Thalassiosira exigua]
MMSFFGFGGKRKAPADSSSGTGYGGQQGDTKRLLAGRKKAEKASDKDDKANLRFLKQIQKQLQYQKRTTRTRSSGLGLDDDDKKNVSSTLADIFRNQVPADWDKRNELYNAALDVARILASNEDLARILGDKEDQEGILFWLLDFSQQADQFIKRGSDLGGSKGDQKDIQFATQVSEVSDAALKMSRRCQPSKPVAELSFISLSERYQSELGPLRFDSVESIQNHCFLKQARSAPRSLNTRLLFKELAAYRTALPVEYGSSCFCRVINNRLDLLRVMITGPDDTPYANGCFLFDINLPANYPKVAPKVQFLTTGGGKIRFNPNLYNCGKVCLSLLGTWQGPGWISGQSTLLQVLISIQSLILVPDPYFNEPGWEHERGTDRGAQMSKAYNKKIRKYTVSAAIESHLTSILGDNDQYHEFEPVMIAHFLEKRSLIQNELWSWVKDDRSLAQSVTNVCTMLETLSNRERGKKRSKRSRGIPTVAKATKSNEPIVLDLDDSGVEEVCEAKSNGPIKSNETIEIDLYDGEEKKMDLSDIEVEEIKNADGDNLVDLT